MCRLESREASRFPGRQKVRHLHLHPPKKPDQKRTAYFPELRTPALFVHGTRDPFGSIEEMEAAIKLIPSKAELLPVEGAGHDLGFKGKTKRQDLPAAISTAFHSFFG